jgi:hypothetical protein
VRRRLLALATASGAGHLDSIGRWFLATFDYQLWAVVFVFTFVLFTFWRRWRYKSWPAQDDYVHLLFSLVSCIGGVIIPIVFLATKPPAIDILSTPLLLLIGLGVPILIFGKAIPLLKALFLPPEAPRPPQDQNTIV